MKIKYVTVVLLIIAGLFILAGCDKTYRESLSDRESLSYSESLFDEDFKTIRLVNANSNLGFEFFLNLGKDSRGTIPVCSDDLYVRGDGYAYQNIDDDVRLSELNISGGEYDVFGIRIGDSADSIQERMSEFGFVLYNDRVLRNETSAKEYRNNNILVTFEYESKKENHTINRIRVKAVFDKNYELNLGTE